MKIKIGGDVVKFYAPCMDEPIKFEDGEAEVDDKLGQKMIDNISAVTEVKDYGERIGS